MKGAEGDAKQALDQRSHTLLSPAVSGKAMDSGALFEEVEEAVALLRSQPRWPTGDGASGKARLAFSTIAAMPPIHGISVYTEKFGDLGRRLASLQ